MLFIIKNFSRLWLVLSVLIFLGFTKKEHNGVFINDYSNLKIGLYLSVDSQDLIKDPKLINDDQVKNRLIHTKLHSLIFSKLYTSQNPKHPMTFAKKSLSQFIESKKNDNQYSDNLEKISKQYLFCPENIELYLYHDHQAILDDFINRRIEMIVNWHDQDSALDLEIVNPWVYLTHGYDPIGVWISSDLNSHYIASLIYNIIVQNNFKDSIDHSLISYYLRVIKDFRDVNYKHQIKLDVSIDYDLYSLSLAKTLSSFLSSQGYEVALYIEDLNEYLQRVYLDSNMSSSGSIEPFEHNQNQKNKHDHSKISDQHQKKHKHINNNHHSIQFHSSDIIYPPPIKSHILRINLQPFDIESEDYPMITPFLFNHHPVKINLPSYNLFTSSAWTMVYRCWPIVEKITKKTTNNEFVHPSYFSILMFRFSSMINVVVNGLHQKFVNSPKLLENFDKFTKGL